jgi:hypothetical protein
MTTIRIFYDGPGLAGRTTSLASALKRLHDSRGWWDVRAAETEVVFPRGDRRCRLLFRVGVARAHLGHDAIDLTDPTAEPRLVNELKFLRETDAILFVVDAREERSEASVEAFRVLQRDLKRHGNKHADSVDGLPIVFQVNRRENQRSLPMDWIREHFRTSRCSYVESDALRDIGTLEALDELVRQTERE